MLDIEIQQDIPLVQNEPFHEVKVSVIPESTQQPPSAPPALPRQAIVDQATPLINFEAVDSFLHKFHALQKDIQEIKQANQSITILESIRSQVTSIVLSLTNTDATNSGPEPSFDHPTISRIPFWHRMSASDFLDLRPALEFCSRGLLWRSALT
ncbi:hypothetical protein Tco_0983730 [Tanacetum coccineum]